MSNKPNSIASLYDITVAAVCNSYKGFKTEIRFLPDAILFDIYITLYQQAKLCVLGIEFSDLDIFYRMLKVTNNRIQLIKCLQALMRHGTGLAKELATAYDNRSNEPSMDPVTKDAVIDIGIKLGGFLSDAGWFSESIRVLTACKRLCLTLPECITSWRKSLECCHKLLHAEVVYSQFNAATKTKLLAENLVEKVKGANEVICLAGLFTQFSLYFFHMSNYEQAYRYSVMAVAELKCQASPRVVIEALSQASKACVVKREFVKAAALVRTAVYLARETFGSKHPKYADTLLDYGFFLLNSDSMKDSVVVYEKALRLKESIFGSLNLHVAVTHEELAYALYVHEYSSGRFYFARKHAEDAISTMMSLLPKEHLLLASAQRVKALILEEIALDHMSEFSENQSKLLNEAEKLHKDALRLARSSFGENNVQTAKHYGNLGRLYQSMRHYKDAELMHLKAIDIKEKLLGVEDYEVGLSVGHLASLYNYHMREYKKAEALYFRSISISLKLFSETYSGLEYDYRGLMHVYESLGDLDNMSAYMTTIERWKALREDTETNRTPPLSLPALPASIQTLQEMLCVNLPPLVE